MLAGLAWLLAGPLGFAQTQWTVDDSGGADFTSLQVAIDSANPGDVLLISPGTYGGCTLGKSLRLLGRPDPVSGALPSLPFLDIQGAPSFSLARLDIKRLRAALVAQRSEISACRLGGGSSWSAQGGIGAPRRSCRTACRTC